MALKITNNATSTLAGSISTGSTSLSVQTGDAAKFPSLSPGDWFPVSVVDEFGNMEIMRCTARSGAVLTVTRAQEGTTAKAFPSGARIDIRFTAAAIGEFVLTVNLLSAILAIDGAGSGVDADLLDGQHGSFYQNASNLNAGTVPNARITGAYSGITTLGISDTLSITKSGDGATLLALETERPWHVKQRGTGANSSLSFENISNKSIGFSSDLSYAGPRIELFPYDTPSIRVDGNVVWHAGNFNPASKLDTTAQAADSALLGGNNSAFYRNASNLNAGAVPDARLSASYTAKYIVDTFSVNGDGGSEQINGLYVADLGTTVGDTGNPTFTAAICGQINHGRSVAVTVDTNGFLYGFRTHTTPGSYTWQSKVREADMLDGQHGSYYADIPARLGYTPLNAATYTAADVLAKLLTVDGSSSGLDADLLDGAQGSFYRNADNLNAGSVPDARIAGAYTAITSLRIHRNPTYNSWQPDTANLEVRSASGSKPHIGFHRQSAGYFALGLNDDNSLFWQAQATGTYAPLFQVSSAGNLTVTGNVTANSDERLKKDVETIADALAIVRSWRGVRFTDIRTGRRNMGVLAGETERSAPELVLSDGQGFKSVAYGNKAAVFIEAIKALMNLVEDLSERLVNLEIGRTPA